MPSVFNIFLISALLCIVQLLALGSLSRSRIAGVREWFVGTGVAFVAFTLYAFGKELPPVIAYEVANGAYAIATAALFVGFRRFFGRTVHWAALGTGIALLVMAIAVFHYLVDSYALRTAAVSVSQVCFQLAIALTIIKSKRTWSAQYPYVITAGMAGLVAVGNGMRAIVHLTFDVESTSLLQPSFWNLLFVSLGAMVLPMLTMGAIMMVHDRMVAKAEHSANRDFLTNAWSRRAFFEIAERELCRVARTGEQLSVLVLDVDCFKSINDRLGHAVGDRVLMDVVLRAEAAIRTNDYFARIGGEEFAVLLPGTDSKEAFVIAERIRKALDRRMSVDSPNGIENTVSYTVSIGIAELQKAESFAQLLNRADAALYSAKASGRNASVLNSA